MLKRCNTNHYKGITIEKGILPKNVNILLRLCDSIVAECSGFVASFCNNYL